MKTLLIFVAASVLWIGLPHPASAYVDGETLLKSCRDKPGSIMRSICLGYIAGVADVMRNAPIGKRKACIDRKLGLTDLIKQTTRFIERSRLDRTKPAADLVVVVFSNEFPCE